MKALIDTLKQKHNVKLIADNSAQNDGLQSFQFRFLEDFLTTICSGLRGIFRNEICLRAAPTSKQVQDRFFMSKSEKKGTLSAVFHGTDESNLPSIYQKGQGLLVTAIPFEVGFSAAMLLPCKGLLVPGGEGVRVLHGASHGNGIYTAKTHNAALSFGFCRGATRPLLVCGVLDDAVALAKPQLLGRHYVTAESQHVRSSDVLSCLFVAG